MCGIHGYFIKKGGSVDRIQMYNSFTKIEPRGPDRSTYIHSDNSFSLGFSRLAIINNTIDGDQPFVYHKDGHTVYTMCNGEIYNYKDICKSYPSDKSDCEVIQNMYMNGLSVSQITQKLVGEYAFSIVDIHDDTITVHLARDQLGIRPLFYGGDSNGFGFSSEMKGLIGLVDGRTIKQLPAGHYCKVVIKNGKLISETLEQYYSFNYTTVHSTLDDYLFNIRQILTKCVVDRLESDRPLGALLSGGLDSSLVVAIASKYMRENFGTKLRTFSIGLAGGTDEKYAKIVAEHCGTEHTHYEVSVDEFLQAVPDVVYATETHDVTTVRASTGQYKISEKISKNTDVKCLLIGDGADELCGGYMYFHKAPTPNDAHNECKRLLQDIHLFDVLRADRCIATHGLEARVPFLDFRFVDYYMSIDPELRVCVQGREKWLLRKAFDGTGYLPDEVLWRRKEAFSDGVSGTEDSWYTSIQKYTKEHIKNYKTLSEKYDHCKPVNEEALYFRQLFEKYFGSDTEHTIPYHWLPKWCGDIKEPSARVLDVYK